MPNCKYCGRDVTLPYTCAYYGGSYCSEHRLPETHQCARRPKGPPPYLRGHDASASERTAIKKAPTIERSLFSPKKVLAFSVIAILIGVLFLTAYSFFLQSNQSPTVPFNPSTTPSSSTTPSPTSSTTSSPTATPETLTRQELLDYALSLINSDRQSRGLQNVTFSDVDSGQRHADELLANHVLSHWDTNGYKPYMRYTLEGGRGAVSENCAWYYISYGLDPFQALEKLEYDMMYDDASSNWGHRDNIIEPNHNKVSIGIAYDDTNIYLVQDFEDDYISWSTLTLDNHVQMQGSILKSGESISQIAIYFDNPTPLTTEQLSNPPYQDGYGAGTLVGGVLPSGWVAGEGITITASTWNQTGQSFAVNFDLSTAFAQYGKGVYTLYLWTNSNEYLTTLSFWN